MKLRHLERHLRAHGCAFFREGGAQLVALSKTTISVVLTPGIALLGGGFMGACSRGAGWKSVRTLSKVEPAEAFRV